MSNLIYKVIETLSPLENDLKELFLGSRLYADILAEMLEDLPGEWHAEYFPSDTLLMQLKSVEAFEVTASDGSCVGSFQSSKEAVRFEFDGVKIQYPWDLLAISEAIIKNVPGDDIRGTVDPAATVNGKLVLGENSVILPGVYIEGDVMIGNDCRIGPNCYLRGNTIIGDNCRIGQAVEVKNSIINSATHIGHLSYVGDSCIGSKVNFGAGTIVANLRHDNGNHRSLIGETLIDSGRRKLGTIIGDNVHTGIHTVIYPGRKLFKDSSTLPGEIVKYDLFEDKEDIL